MTHTPPVPPENQSPYPRQEPSHVHHVPLPEKSAANDDERADGPVISAKALGIGAAVGIGSAAIVAGLLYARSGDKSKAPAKAKPAKPKTATRKPRTAATRTARKPAARKTTEAKA